MALRLYEAENRNTNLIQCALHGRDHQTVLGSGPQGSMNRKNSNPALIQCALRGGVITTVPVNLPEALQPPKIHNPIFKQRAGVNNIVYSINHPKTTHVPYLVYRNENSQFLPNPLLKSSPGVSQRLNDCDPPFHPCTQTKINRQKQQ